MARSYDALERMYTGKEFAKGVRFKVQIMLLSSKNVVLKLYFNLYCKPYDLFLYLPINLNKTKQYVISKQNLKSL